MKNFEPATWWERAYEVFEKWRAVTGYFLLAFVVIGGFVLLYQEKNRKGVVTETRHVVEETVEPIEEKIISTQTISPASAAKQESKTSQSSAQKSSEPPTPSPQKSALVNINTASAAQLDSLPGIGPIYAQRIIDYRTASGPFKSKEQIKDVKGIGDKTFQKFKDQITI